MRAFSTRHPLSTRAKAMGNRPQVGSQLSYKLTRVLNFRTMRAWRDCSGNARRVASNVGRLIDSRASRRLGANQFGLLPSLRTMIVVKPAELPATIGYYASSELRCIRTRLFRNVWFNYASCVSLSLCVSNPPN